MRTIRFYIETDGGTFEDSIEVEDDLTDDEISDIVYDEVLAQIGWGWEEEK